MAKSKELTVIVMNPPSEEHKDEVIEKLNGSFRIKYSTTEKPPAPTGD